MLDIQTYVSAETERRRKQDAGYKKAERERRKKLGLVMRQIWVYPEDWPKIRAYRDKLTLASDLAKQSTRRPFTRGARSIQERRRRAP